MIDLTRRNFIKNVGFVGATTLFCGGSLLAKNSFSSCSDLDNETEDILSNFTKYSHSDVFLTDSALLECFKKTSLHLKKIGYLPTGNFCYSSMDNQVKIFPMHLQINGSGKVDNLLLCFGKNSTGEWTSLRTLSGFDLEAITVALKELKKQNNSADLSNYLLPAPIQSFNPYSFETKRGSVFLKTQLSYNQTLTKILVKEGSTIIFEKEIISQHSLTVDSVLA